MLLLLSIYAVASQHANAVTVYNAQTNQLESNRSLSANTGVSINSSRTVTSITFKVKECKINNILVSCTALSKLINSLKIQASLSAAMASPNGVVIAAIIQAIAAVIAIIGSIISKAKEDEAAGKRLQSETPVSFTFPLRDCRIDNSSESTPCTQVKKMFRGTEFNILELTVNSTASDAAVIKSIKIR
ncbi:MAG TPA: hypothetical protein VF884_09095 [Nitrososphaeraceae archaeon]